MLEIFKNKYFLKKLYKQTWQKSYHIFSISFKQNKRLSLLLRPQNKGDRVFIVLETKMLTEYRGKGIRYLIVQEKLSAVKFNINIFAFKSSKNNNFTIDVHYRRT